MLAARLRLALVAASRPVVLANVGASSRLVSATPARWPVFASRMLSTTVETAANASAEPKKDAPASPAATEEKKDLKTEEVAVPRNLVKFLIGPKGANLKTMLQRAGGGTIVFNKQANEQGEEGASIRGDDRQVAELKKLLAEEIEKAKPMAAAAEQAKAKGEKPRSEKGHSEANYMEEVIVDRIYVGSLIGKQGAVLKEMEATSGARIFYSDRVDSNKERTAQLRGTKEQVQMAKKLITDRIYSVAEEMRNNRPSQGDRRSNSNGDSRPKRSYQPSPNDVKQVVEVPSEAVGFLIGRQGRGLFNIQDLTKTRLDFAREDHREGAREVTIYGTEENVQKACEIVQQRVKEGLELNRSRVPKSA